jgi:hypothetical protein
MAKQRPLAIRRREATDERGTRVPQTSIAGRPSAWAVVGQTYRGGRSSDASRHGPPRRFVCVARAVGEQRPSIDSGLGNLVQLLVGSLFLVKRFAKKHVSHIRNVGS